jgi:hypothetical protein
MGETEHTSPLPPLIGRKTLALIGACVASAAAWGIAPLAQQGRSVDATPIDSGALSSRTIETPLKPDVKALDQSLFKTPLWVVPKPPPAPPAPPPPAPPLRLQLLALLEESGQRTAVVFDPDTQLTSTVRAGESVSRRQVLRIDATTITLLDAGIERTLSLEGGETRRDAAPGRAGGAGSGGQP